MVGEDPVAPGEHQVRVEFDYDGGGVGKGGTAKPAHLIGVFDAKDVLIYNVKALESRYDCLYVRTCNNLKVINCHFDRAGRNVVSIVGNTDGFIFSNCYLLYILN